MKYFTRFALFALLAAAGIAQAQTTTISALPAGGALAGTESIPMDQTACASPATCKTTPAAIDTYVLGQGVPLSALPAQASPTVLGNNSGSSSTPLALNPLAVANMANAPIAATLAATAVIPNLSGFLTIDGAVTSAQTPVLVWQNNNFSGTVYISSTTLTVSVASVAGLSVGQTVTIAGASPGTYLITGYTSGTGGAGSVFTVGAACVSGCGTSGSPVAATSNGQFQNGIYIPASGAWTRAANFPSGYVIPQGCVLLVYITSGTTYNGQLFLVNTSIASLTIGTSGIQIQLNQRVPGNASTTLAGAIKSTSGSGALYPAAQYTGNGANVAAADNCVAFDNTGTGGIANLGDGNGNRGPCTITSATTFHLLMNNGGFPPAASVGTLNPNSTDHWGIVTGLSAATTLTITFTVAYPGIGTNTAVACVANDSAGTAVGVSYTSSGTPPSTTAVTFTMSALTGSLSYNCLGGT